MAVELIRNFEAMSDRYKYDFRLCTYANGWAQIDTRQDAPYYGTWTNPDRREIFNYCEGDLCLTRCDTDDEYRIELRKTIDWNKEAGHWIGIDPGFSAEMRDKFVLLGFEDALH
jgi:hypothetical protein